MTVTLSPSGDRQLSGMEIVTLQNTNGSRCVIQRGVVAVRIN
jgi:hypothetical protein